MQRRDFLKSCFASLLFTGGYDLSGQSQEQAVSFDERSLLVHGKRVMLSCGEMHYPRSTRAMWPAMLERSKALGLNTIATYVFWNIHEPQRGVYDFSGEHGLGHFLDLCQQHGLMVFLRAGPYICAEWNYGGFPPWLRDEPGITIRTMNKPYTDRVEAYFEQLAKVIQPRLASRGGPVILVQIENEYLNVANRYGEAGREYLRWIIQMAKRVGLAEVPLTTCQGGAKGAIETSNGFGITEKRIATVRQNSPGTPLIWSELYPSWYRIWGGEIKPARGASVMSAGILDFVSRGGSGWNYYMWQGGTNFGRTSMYLQTTSYDFDAPLDEYGDITQTGEIMSLLHHTLQEHVGLLLEGDRTEALTDAGRSVVWRKGSESLRLEQAKDRKTAKLLDADGKVIFDTMATPARLNGSFVPREWKELPEPDSVRASWVSYSEPIPRRLRSTDPKAEQPIEQLSLTKDTTDYCWYSSTVQVGAAAPCELTIPYGGDFFYIYIDGKLAASSALPLDENRGPITPEDSAHPRVISDKNESLTKTGFRQTFTLHGLPPGTHRLDILSAALGMVKGDWQILSPMNFERKGIWEGVLWNGAPLHSWTMRPGLQGEELMLAQKPALGHWRKSAAPGPLTWHRRRFTVPEPLLRSGAVFRIDAMGLGKGMLWVNGHCLGRHWLLAALSPANTLSQQFYHLPADWLRASNEVVVLEEQAGSPTQLKIQSRHLL